jgi:hypothetical protein
MNINVYDLKHKSRLSAVVCDSFSEAASVCLAYHEHKQEIPVRIVGDLEAEFLLSYQEVTEQIQNSHDDLEDATEEGAYCIAMLVIEHLTELQTVKRAKKTTGIDYFLGKKDKTEILFEPVARLEVSGILKGNKSKINQRIREKEEQIKQSNLMNLPVYIVVVEFSKPIVNVILK